MNPQGRNGWMPGSGPGQSPPTSEHNQAQQRPQGTFGHNLPMQQSPPSQMTGPSILQQPPPFYSNQQHNHSLPNPPNMSQSSPLQHARGPPSIQHSPPSVQQRPVQPPGYPLAAMGPALQPQQSPHGPSDAEREAIERERARDHEIQQEMMALEQRRRYEQENEILQHQREQQAREQQHRDANPSPRENHTGAIPIQQPVASRIPATLHGPNGILNDQNSTGVAPPTQSSLTLGAPSGPANIFSSSSQPPNDANLRNFQQAQSLPPQQLLGISNAATPQVQNGAALSQPQQQQPILNDALSYLDQVKVQFQAEPDVYNRFLDIMKDFKSQAIDTPGVIDRVSQLFTGHPQLIQGFNTFLPPGYRIECGTRDDPNAIRVTTPMGTTVQQMPSLSNRLSGPNGVMHETGRPGFYADGPPNGEWAPHRQEMDHQDDTPYPTSAAQMELENRLQQERAEHGSISDALLAQQQGQRGVSNLVSAASSNLGPDRGIPPQMSPGTSQAMLLGPSGMALNNAAIPNNQLGMEKRGPVEFNHAIGYVNKIKNRFAQQPEIYKQFLDILQTYQRESKPIQDVYAQVTQLFNSAPDLLEDFKQFLPESAAQAKAQAQAQAQAQAHAAAHKMTEDVAMLSDIRGEPSYGASQHAQAHTPRPADVKMPPVGNFAPPSVGKESKKRRGGPGSQITGGTAASDPALGLNVPTSRNGARGAPVNKRAKTEQMRATAPEAPLVSPTLVPALPTPMPPSKEMTGTPEQLAFFDRVKKFLSNKQTFNEFLKLCNLFTQELIDRNTLMLKAHSFVGGNNELSSWFKNWIKYDGRDEVIENKPRIPGDKVVLSNCRGLGPSYRLLPRRERLRQCAGRDEVCHEVLNDVWVSHPTWASEDSGFVAHRKNTFEESLHRIEEERHDYDINIEACVRTIQLMEPIAQQFLLMTDKERYDYRLPPGLGGQSETIYQRVIKKIYDRERGGKVIEDMFRRPSAVLPVVLGRLKQKAEEWKASQREWEKVWREQTNRIFWKSLDHQGINTKTAEKRQFQPKTLQTEIQVRYEEQRRQKIVPWNDVPNYQFKYSFVDLDVVQDACHLILAHLRDTFLGNELDRSRLETFVKTFIPTFFDLDRETFELRISDIYDTTPPNEEAEEETTADGDTNTPRGRRTGKKSTLLRGVLERGKIGQKEDVDSKESTPDVQSNEDTPASTGTPTEQPQIDATEHRWLSHPATGNKTADLNVPFKRDDFHLYASSNIYCFFRMFETLYDRLVKLKSNEAEVHKDVQRSKLSKPADKLGLTDKKPDDFFTDTSPSTNYYEQMLTMMEDTQRGVVESGHLEETLRRFYMKSGWQLYNFERLTSALLRFALQILVSDNKDKSLDIINLFYKDRKEDETTHQAELTYRKQVEKFTKEGDVYRIKYNRLSRTATIQIFTKESKTFEADELAAHARWSYYVSSFSMLDRTEGIPPEKIQFPFLRRNLPTQLDTEEEYNEAYSPAYSEDGLIIRISPNNYHMLYDPGTADYWIHTVKQQKRGLKGYAEVKEHRKAALKAMTEDKEKNAWMRGRSDAVIEQTNRDYEIWIKDGPADVRAEKEKERQKEAAAAAAATATAEAEAAATAATTTTTTAEAAPAAPEPPTEPAAPEVGGDQVMTGT